MATRTQVRQSVVGLLYAYESGNEGIEHHIDEILANGRIRNKQKEFALGLFDGVLENMTEIDKKISENLSQRDIHEVGMVEKSILRLSVYEIIFTKIDKPIVINEAITISKLMASDNAPKFINGLLDAVK
jgi:N utilization substance protein B